MRTNLHSLGPVATQALQCVPDSRGDDSGQQTLRQSRRDARGSMGYSHENVVFRDNEIR